MSNGCNSQYTPISRTRRAISWVYETEVEDQDAVGVNVEGHESFSSVKSETTRGCHQQPRFKFVNRLQASAGRRSLSTYAIVWSFLVICTS